MAYINAKIVTNGNIFKTFYTKYTFYVFLEKQTILDDMQIS